MRSTATVALICLLLAAPARGASVDMSTQTCQDWIDADEEEQDQMVAWLRGYLAGRSTSSLFDLSASRADAAALKRFCQGNPTVGLVSAASQWRH